MTTRTPRRPHLSAAMTAITALLFALSTAPIGEAHAVAALPDYWVADIPTETLVGVPLPGLVAIPARVVQGNCGTGNTSSSALYTVTLTVTDADGVERSGSLSYSSALASVLWEPDTPLTAGATYSVDALFSNTLLEECGFGGIAEDLQGQFDIVIADAGLGEPTAPADLQGTLTESIDSQLVCCPVKDDPALCDPRLGCPAEHCWADSYDYQPALDLTWTEGGGAVEQLLTTYEVLRVTDVGAEVVTRTARAGEATVVFPEEAERYCARVRTLSPLNDAAVESADVCLSADQLVPIPREDPPEPDLSPCESLPEGYEVAEDEGCGCALLDGRRPRGSSTRTTLVVIAGLLIGAARRRRRR